MKIRFNMVIEDTEPIELLNMERGELQAGNIGLSSAEVKSLLSCAQKALIDARPAHRAAVAAGAFAARLSEGARARDPYARASPP